MSSEVSDAIRQAASKYVDSNFGLLSGVDAVERMILCFDAGAKFEREITSSKGQDVALGERMEATARLRRHLAGPPRRADCGPYHGSPHTPASDLDLLSTPAPTVAPDALREAIKPFLHVAEPILHNDERWLPDEWFARLKTLTVQDFRVLVTAALSTQEATDRVEALLSNENGDALARVMAERLALEYNWQHIRKAGRAAADLFAALGYGDIAFIATPQEAADNGK